MTGVFVIRLLVAQVPPAKSGIGKDKTYQNMKIVRNELTTWEFSPCPDVTAEHQLEPLPMESVLLSHSALVGEAVTVVKYNCSSCRRRTMSFKFEERNV